MLDSQLVQWHGLAEQVCAKMGILFTPASSWKTLGLVPDYTLLKKQAAQTPKLLRANKIYMSLLASKKLEKEHIIEQGKPSIDTFVSYKLYDSDTSNVGIKGNMGYNDYIVGVKSEFDLGQRNTRGQLLAKEEESEQLFLEWQKVKRDLKLQKNRLTRGITQNSASQKTYTNIVQWSQARLSKETVRYNTGKVALKNVVDSQNEALANELTLLEYQIQAQKLLINKMALDDELLNYLKIHYQLELTNLEVN